MKYDGMKTIYCVIAAICLCFLAIGFVGRYMVGKGSNCLTNVTKR